MDAQNYDVADSIVAKWLNDHDPKGMSEAVKWGEGDATKFTFTDGSVALLEEDGVSSTRRASGAGELTWEGHL